jgi:hypothetical protein
MAGSNVPSSSVAGHACTSAARGPVPYPVLVSGRDWLTLVIATSLGTQADSGGCGPRLGALGGGLDEIRLPLRTRLGVTACRSRRPVAQGIGYERSTRSLWSSRPASHGGPGGAISSSESRFHSDRSPVTRSPSSWDPPSAGSIRWSGSPGRVHPVRPDSCDRGRVYDHGRRQDRDTRANIEQTRVANRLKTTTRAPRDLRECPGQTVRARRDSNPRPSD